VFVPMVSGRGLGHTGGTLDKLESIPGFRTSLRRDEFLDVLRRVGTVMAGQSDDMVPADRRMYALRDVTATVESLPLITSSILSKKIAAGPRALVFDVKVGRGAFFADRARAAGLAAELVSVACAFGRRAVAFLTDMDRPLGRTIGNSVEVEEAIAVLRGEAPADVTEVTMVLGAAMLVLAGASPDLPAAKRVLEAKVSDGSGLQVLRDLIRAQGGDERVVDQPELLPSAASEVFVPSPSDGVVADIDPRALAELAVDLGAGRRRVDDGVDHGAGLLIARAHGDVVRRGETLATIRFTKGDAATWIARAQGAFVVTRSPVPERAVILGIVDSEGERPWVGWETAVGRSAAGS
jgi:pyrimidine-nucleoside phosphorylase